MFALYSKCLGCKSVSFIINPFSCYNKPLETPPTEGIPSIGLGPASVQMALNPKPTNHVIIRDFTCFVFYRCHTKNSIFLNSTFSFQLFQPDALSLCE